MAKKLRYAPFPSAQDDALAAEKYTPTPQTEASAYKLAYLDAEFMMSDELRPVRLQLELLKPEIVQQAAGIESTVVVFGSARILDPESARSAREKASEAVALNPENDNLLRALAKARQAEKNSSYYRVAREFGHQLASSSVRNGSNQCAIITGGGPGIMEAANRGAAEAGAKTIGLNIVLPTEQAPNPYISPELCFQFHYFAIRKMHFLMRAKALVAFPGGFGTLDELFETLTLIQTQKVKRIPVLLFGRSYWERLINFDVLVEEGMISEKDLEIFHYVESAEEAYSIIANFCRREHTDDEDLQP